MLAGTDPKDPEDYPGKPVVTPTPTPPVATPTPTPPVATPTPTIPPVTPTPSQTLSPTPTPGFEAVFTIAGLLAVAYMALRKKKR